MTKFTGTEGVLQHLLFHKAMIDEHDGAEKIDYYLSILENNSETSSTDPLDRSIETVFDLVLNNNLDPWDIDLMRFTQLYTERVQDSEVNFVLAGKLMLMAWSILRMQSEKILINSEDQETEVMDEFYDDFSSEREVLCMPDEVSLYEVVRRKGSRAVTLVELLEAFEDARREEQQNLSRIRIRENKPKNEKFDTKAHNDDMERDVETVWARIMKCGPGEIDIEDIWEGDREDLVTVFMSILFLARDGKIDLWQEEGPYGRIRLQVRIEGDIATIEDISAPELVKEIVIDSKDSVI
ncbi:chromosome segregation protein ScpA [Candidatus Methanomassiliicoccus intestinalis]|uniref:chromosome segregation protein ScpA n=1 Tax=Candidatus Methanomassiliicoccus intestinalis TaxID=1406512 RepID=UPI0037DD1A4E